MTPLEELQAAHQRLTTLREGGAPSPWHVGESDPAPGWEMNRAVDCADDGAVTDYIDVVDAELIVTLHCTIDAQLSMLELGIAEHTLLSEQWGDEYGEASEVDLLGIVGLARAINGEAS